MPPTETTISSDAVFVVADGSDKPRRYVSIPTTMARLEISASTVYRLLNNGKLHAVKVGRITRVCERSIEEFVSSLPAHPVKAA
jgi:excisionase family DNA binding protein